MQPGGSKLAGNCQRAVVVGQDPGGHRTCQGLILCEKIRTEATYFYQNAERMAYTRFRSAGYAIGCGTIKSACKQIVTQRLKKSSAKWEVGVAVKTAKARAAWLSHEWDLPPYPIPSSPWLSDNICVHTSLFVK